MRRALAPALALIAACGADAQPPNIVDLERPSDIAFACFGNLRLTMGEPATVEQDIVDSAQPVSACRTWFGGGRPAGQEDLEGEAVRNPVAPSFVNFVLEPAKGTLAVVVFDATANGLTTAGVIDTDPLTPGRNPVPVGTMPVSVVTSSDGCEAVTANAGSCDLSVIDVASAVAPDASPRVDRVQVVTPGGGHVLARPADLVAGPPGGEVGFTCPDSPQGLVWVAYPDCHAVAAVELASGAVRASIRFDAAGAAVIGDGELSCLDECGEGAVAASHDATTPRPIALHLAGDGQRLYIGAQNRPELTVVDLDADLLPTAVGQVAVEGIPGELGLRRLVDTGEVAMGGATGFLGDGDAGVMDFVYAIASDNTIRVIEVSAATAAGWKECDTQIDPRALHDVTDVTLLSCIPVGTPQMPRRPGARSPGVHLPRTSAFSTRDYEGIPLDLGVAQVDRPADVEAGEGRTCVRLRPPGDQLAPSPFCLIGTFVFVSTADGQVFVVNVDDDVYPDVEDPLDPGLVSMPLAVAHQVRDYVANRDDVDGFRTSNPGDGTTVTEPPPAVACGATAAPDQLGARMGEDLTQLWDSDNVAGEKTHLLPTIRAGICTPDSGTGDVIVPELAFGAPVDVREQAFPDIHEVRNETWTITWEGPVSLDPADRVIDGPLTRIASARSGIDSFHIEDASAPFCRTGVERYDVAALVGCDPSRGDSQCGTGETCYVHPDTPASLASGMCLPAGQVDALAEECRGLLTTRRRYTITDVFADHVVLVPRRRVLLTTPPEGCADTDHCNALWERQRALVEPDQPNAEDLEPPEQDYVWSCEPDPTRAGTANRCVMTCTADEECEEGWACSDEGYCVEGPLPPRRCIAALQRYQLRLGDSFTVIGSQTGFLHNQVRAADGRCETSPTPNPLQIGRLSLSAPPCEPAVPGDPVPNPCSTTVQHSDEVDTYELTDGVCVAVGSELRTREVAAIRFDNPAMRFHLVEPVTTGDAVCLGDGGGGSLTYATVHPGFQVRFDLTGGLLPLFVNWDAVSNLAIRYPAVLAPAPDGGIWVLDQGDRSLAVQGQIVRIDPAAAASSFGVVVTSTGR